MNEKKPYTPPTVTDHGKVTTETKGMVSTSYETFGRRLAVDDPKDVN